MKAFLSTVFCIVAATAPAQRLTILIDPARGGSEHGARMDDRTYEKQVNLDLANRLRALLNARDFNVILTRDGDNLLSNDQRATAANQSNPVACLLLHSTASGTGVHLYSSSLPPAPPSSTAVLWDEAQAPFVQRSQRLANEVTTALGRSHIFVSSGRTWIRPLDNMQCPAVAIEVSPESSDTPATDRAYQTRIVDAIAGAMLSWRSHPDIVQSIVPPPPPTTPAVSPAASSASDTASSGTAANGNAKTAPAAGTSTPRPNSATSPLPETPRSAVPRKPAAAPASNGGTRP